MPGAPTPTLPTLHICRFVNESSCPFTQHLLADSQTLIVAYNPLSQQTSQQVTILLASSVCDVSNSHVDVQVSLADTYAPVYAELFPSFASADVCRCVFTAVNVPAMSTSTYILSLTSASASTSVNTHTKRINRQKVVRNDQNTNTQAFTNGIVTVNMDLTTGLMASMSRVMNDEKKTVVSIDITNNIGYYVSYDDYPFNNLNKADGVWDSHRMKFERVPGVAGYDKSTQPSGAYIFRPETNEVHLITDDNSNKNYVEYFSGEEMIEIHQVFNAWTSQIIRIRRDMPTVEFEWTVGSVDISDRKGKEVVNLFKSSMSTSGKIYTDSNGREFMPRMRDYRPTWELVSVYLYLYFIVLHMHMHWYVM